ncbi:MAG TPA: hypothetical protein DHV48_11095 [Prolixibacteraceae bacterium]|nr:hypothetical protein [Prolixibacteraceae bacterium]
MKLINILGIILFSFLLAGCEDEEWARIDSLSTDGNEFFCNQKVKLWMVVESNNLVGVDYQWACEGGRLTQPQGLNEMTWQAPTTPGIYKVSCTTTIGGKSETRSHDMNVSSFYFEKFEKSSYSFKGQSSTTLTKSNEVLNGKTNGYLQAVAKITTEATRYIYYNFGDPTLKTPFSCGAKLGWISDFPTASVKVGTKTSVNSLYYQVTMNRDPDKEDVMYIDDIRFEWYPVGVTTGLPLDPVTGQPYNGCFKFEQNNGGSKTWFQVSVNVPELNFAKGENKRLAINIGTDYKVSVYVAGALVLETDAIQQWRTTNAAKDDMFVNEWRLVFPNGNGGNKPPKIYFDDAYALVDGTVLKGL